MSELVIAAADPPLIQNVRPRPGSDWRYTGLTVVDVGRQGRWQIAMSDQEALVIPLAGSGDVTADGQQHRLSRRNVFDGPSDSLYVPAGTEISFVGNGRFAITTAAASPGPAVAFIPAAEVAVVARGAGMASRLVRNYAMPGSFSACQQLLVCEVITPGGNWSSYPAHKHDEQSATERILEEIYYYEIAAGPQGQPGFAFHQNATASPQRPNDVLAAVRTGDVVLVPYGWHGPVGAPPGHDTYYLNVMAGPDPDREWLISDHPQQTWVRQTWDDQAVDPRVTSAVSSAKDPR